MEFTERPLAISSPRADLFQVVGILLAHAFVGEDLLRGLGHFAAAENQRRSVAVQVDRQELALRVAEKFDEVDEVADRRPVDVRDDAEGRRLVALGRLVRQQPGSKDDDFLARKGGGIELPRRPRECSAAPVRDMAPASS